MNKQLPEGSQVQLSDYQMIFIFLETGKKKKNILIINKMRLHPRIPCKGGSFNSSLPYGCPKIDFQVAEKLEYTTESHETTWWGHSWKR